MSKQKKAPNYLAFVPVRNPDIVFSVDENNLVTLHVEWKGFYHRIAQKFFHKPRVSQIAMDAYGSFVWLQIDGGKDVHQLSLALDAAFQELDKGLPRLMKFLEILRGHRFILWKEDAK